MNDGCGVLVRIEAPICAFRPFASRQYQDTYPVPTPASVYGMLLSYLGIDRQDKSRYLGVQMALALTPSRPDTTSLDAALPVRSSVFRKMRRVSQYGYNKIKKQGADAANRFILSSRRPDYQDLLTDVTLWVWLKDGVRSNLSLPKAMVSALHEPSSIKSRYGGLSLGESCFLVNRINCVATESVPSRIVVLRPSQNGFYSLPVWTDHENDRPNVQRFDLDLTSPIPPQWFTIAPTELNAQSGDAGQNT